MQEKHYQVEELKLFFDPKFGEKSPDLERQILGHLQTCEVCSNLAQQVQTELWAEIKSEFKGF